MAQAIEDHGIVGDLRTAALIDLNGTIDFLCWPQFDSPSLFASLLDETHGGSFQLAPVLDGARHRQLYLPDTNILLTRFLSEHGVAAISDFMPLGGAETTPRLVRRVKAIRKTIRFRMQCAPRFDYARARHETRADGDGIVFTGADGLSLRLRSSVEMRIEDGAAVAEFDLEPGQSAHFILEDGECGADSAAAQPDYVVNAFKATSTYWHDWVARSTYHGRWRDVVSRSSLALKLLTSAEHGSMIAWSRAAERLAGRRPPALPGRSKGTARPIVVDAARSGGDRIPGVVDYLQRTFNALSHPAASFRAASRGYW